MLVHRRRRQTPGRNLTTTAWEMLAASEQDDGHLEMMGLHRNQETGRIVLLEARSTRLPGVHPHFFGPIIKLHDPKTRPEPATLPGEIRGKKAATTPSLRDKPSSRPSTSLEFARHSPLQRSCPALLNCTERRTATRQVLSLHIKPSPTPFSLSKLGLGKPHAESAQSEKVAPSLRHAPGRVSHVREEKGLSRTELAHPAEPVPVSAHGESGSSKKGGLKVFHAREEKGLSRVQQGRLAELRPASADGGLSENLKEVQAIEQDKRELLALLQSAIASGFVQMVQGLPPANQDTPSPWALW